MNMETHVAFALGGLILLLGYAWSRITGPVLARIAPAFKVGDAYWMLVVGWALIFIALLIYVT